MLPRHLLICCLSMAAAACHKKPVADALFSKGLFPVVFAPADFALHPKSGMRMQSSKECAPCHETAYRNWNLSRHKVALSNELYRESHEREPSPWCVNCHAPLRLTGTESKPFREDEGVSCLVCHVRSGKILAKNLPKEPKAHEYSIDKQLGDERFCEGCHEFNFPTAATAMREGHALHYTDQPMQSTVSEYRSSAFYGNVSCSGCHLFPYTAASHRFPGGHAIERLRQDLRVEITRTSPGFITLRIFALGIGHSFPTGDLFRTLRVRVIDPGGKTAEELELRHYFEPIAGAAKSSTLPLKRRVREETLPPPQLDYVSMREYTLAWPGSSRDVITELYIDYLNQMNTMTTRLSPRLTRPLIKRETHRLPVISGADAKG